MDADTAQFVLVMEAAEDAGSLQDFCQSGPHDPLMLRAVGKRVVQCVAELHELGLVHLDLKVRPCSFFTPWGGALCDALEWSTQSSTQ